MNANEFFQREEDQIIETLPSGVTMVINGSPSIDNCKVFLKLLLRLGNEYKGKST